MAFGPAARLSAPARSHSHLAGVAVDELVADARSAAASPWRANYSAIAVMVTLVSSVREDEIAFGKVDQRLLTLEHILLPPREPAE